MTRFEIDTTNRILVNQCREGETLEMKVRRVLTNGEPIKDGAPLVYTPRNEGVKPEYNIRTDRFDLALESMDKVSRSYVARRDSKPDMKVEKGGNNDAGSESIEGGNKQENAG